jgi:hypothetical protein
VFYNNRDGKGRAILVIREYPALPKPVNDFALIGTKGGIRGILLPKQNGIEKLTS